MNIIPRTVFMRCEDCKKPLRYRKTRKHKVCAGCFTRRHNKEKWKIKKVLKQSTVQ